MGRKNRPPTVLPRGELISPIWIIAGLMMLVNGTGAEVRIDDLLEIDGYLSIGMQASNNGNIAAPSRYRIWGIEGAQIVESELDFVVTPTDNIEAHFDLHGDMSEPGIELQKALIEFDLKKRGEIRLGRMKKDFGLEDESSRADLLTVRRSYLYTFLESFLALGYDFAFNYAWDGNKGEKETGARVSIGSDGDVRAFVVLGGSAQRTWGALNLTTMYMHHATDPELTNLNLGVAGYTTDHGVVNAAYEVAAGKDPNATETTIRLGERRDIFFLGFRTLHAVTFDRTSSPFRAIQPILGTVILLYDLTSPRRARLQLVPGCNFLLNKEGTIRWMNNLELLFAANAPGSPGVTTQSIGVLSQVQLSW